MELFREDGHLTDQALEALVSGRELNELGRLEVSEHLAFCDLCLNRYTQQLMDEGLMTPAHSCRDTIWWRIRQRAARPAAGPPPPRPLSWWFRCGTSVCSAALRT